VEETAMLAQRLHRVEEDVRCHLAEAPRPMFEDKDTSSYPTFDGELAAHTHNIQKIEPEEKLVLFEQRLLKGESNIALITSILKSMEGKLSESPKSRRSNDMLDMTSPRSSLIIALHNASGEAAQAEYVVAAPQDDPEPNHAIGNENPDQPLQTILE